MVEERLEDWLEEGYAVSYRTACLILGNQADAEEAVQEAFLRGGAFVTTDVGPEYQAMALPGVVNSCYSKLRREIPHRDRRADADALPSSLASNDSDPAVCAQRSEVADTVLAALQRLPVSLRVPVVLRYYADLSERDIAVAIGRRPGTVKSRLHEARLRLANDPSLVTLAGDGDVDDPVEA